MFVAVTYSASAKGSTAVAVRCEKCSQKYYYKLTCTAIGRGSAPYGIGQEKAKQLARRMARQKLWEMLDTEIRAVPCPHCGWYQEAMLPLLRKPRLKRLQTVGWTILIVGGGFAFLAGVLFYGVLVQRPGVSLTEPIVVGLFSLPFLLTGAVLLLVRRHLNASFDPNDPEKEQERIELGRRLSITKERAEELMNPYDD
jgi:hypothetical protein